MITLRPDEVNSYAEQIADLMMGMTPEDGRAVLEVVERLIQSPLTPGIAAPHFRTVGVLVGFE